MSFFNKPFVQADLGTVTSLRICKKRYVSNKDLKVSNMYYEYCFTNKYMYRGIKSRNKEHVK